MLFIYIVLKCYTKLVFLSSPFCFFSLDSHMILDVINNIKIFVYYLKKARPGNPWGQISFKLGTILFLSLYLPFLASCICRMTSSRSACSVAVVTRKEPSRVNVVRLASKVAVTPHSFSRFCFRSRHAANAQPTAWLRRSP